MGKSSVFYRTVCDLRTALIGGCFLGASLLPSAYAATNSSNMNVIAKVKNKCLITANTLDFGEYDPISANSSAALDGASTLSVKCANYVCATITLGQGNNPASGSSDPVPLRRMKDGSTNYLSYKLYQNNARTTIWGNTLGTGEPYTGTGSTTSVNVYGRVDGGQSVPPGDYSDVVVATITF